MTEHKNIAAALAAAQAQMGRAIKDTQNPHFRSKYADLGSVMDACMSALNSNGIAVIQPLVESEMGGRYVVTKFIHESGEVLESPIPLILGKNDMQGLGSAITYARRYGLMGLAGVAPDDDDGDAAAASAPKEGITPKGGKSWADTILDELPPEATNKERARAVADAIIANFKRKKTAGELSNEWDRREAERNRIAKAYPEMLDEIVDAYETRKNEITVPE